MRDSAIFTHWLAVFRFRRASLLPMAAERADLTPEERTLIGNSMATFQLGESSEGEHLRASARRFAERFQIPELPELTRLFIAEEQFHAALLGAFMDRNAIAHIRSQYSDRIFRWLRRPFSFELTLRVLVTAELIGVSYYRCLAKATGSEALVTLCRRILEDEDIHLRYERAVAASISSIRGRSAQTLVTLFHGCLLAAAIAVVFVGHRRVLRSGGLRATQFWKACWQSFSDWCDISEIGVSPTGASPQNALNLPPRP